MHFRAPKTCCLQTPLVGRVPSPKWTPSVHTSTYKSFLFGEKAPFILTNLYTAVHGLRSP